MFRAQDVELQSGPRPMIFSLKGSLTGRKCVGLGKSCWMPPSCVTLDKTLNLSEPQSITSLSLFSEPRGPPAFRIIVLIPSIPEAQYTWPVPRWPPSSPPPSHPPALPHPCAFQTIRHQILSIFPLNIRVVTSPSGLTASPPWSRPPFS